MIEYQTSYHPSSSLYFELFGETSPLITPGYTQLMLEENGDSKHCTNLVPLYECYWSLGYVASDPNPKWTKWTRNLWRRKHRKMAAEVYLYFPTTGGGAGPIAASSAVLLDVIAKLKITSIPPVKNYKWSVQKVAEYVSEEGKKEKILVHGVKWTIPAKLFIEFGSRLTGSIAVTIIPAPEPSKENPDRIQLTPKPIRARAVVYRHPGFQVGKCFELPAEGESKYLKLNITPSQSEGRSGSSK